MVVFVVSVSKIVFRRKPQQQSTTSIRTFLLSSGRTTSVHVGSGLLELCTITGRVVSLVGHSTSVRIVHMAVGGRSRIRSAASQDVQSGQGNAEYWLLAYSKYANVCSLFLFYFFGTTTPVRGVGFRLTASPARACTVRPILTHV